MSDNHISRFDRVSHEYISDLDRNLRLTSGDSSHFYQAKLRQVVALLDFKPTTILDFGCATGDLTKRLNQYFSSAHTTGYDPSIECIKVAQKKPSKVNFISRLEDLKSEPDLVVAAGVFHHIPPTERENSINKIFALMKPSGVLFVFEHNPFNPFTRLIVAMAAVDKGAKLVSCRSMQSLMISTGFEDIRSKYISFFPPAFGPLLDLEKHLEGCPFGAQHLVWAKKPNLVQGSNEKRAIGFR